MGNDMDKKRIIKIVVGILAIYVGLSIILYIAEGTATSGGAIHTVGDIVWYVLATLTTVGYGDVTPVTGIGKLIGAIIMFSSAGVLTFLLGLLVSLFFGKLVPVFALWKNRKCTWYVFSDANENTRYLAERLISEDPKAHGVFCTDPGSFRQDSSEINRRITAIDEDADTVVGMQNGKNPCHVFFMTTNGWDNYDEAVKFLEKNKRDNVTVYCETEYQPEHMPRHMVIFNLPDNTARSYWLDAPIEPDEKLIVFIGGGHLAYRMLERGLLINVLPDSHPLEYHLFGEWGDFRRDHFELEKAVLVDKISDESDSVIFESRPWNEDADLIRRADRIIIAGDDEDENIVIMNKLSKYFPHKACLDIYASFAGDGSRVIGAQSRVFSRETVMKDRLNYTAVTLNDLYRNKTGGGSDFNELETFYRQSNISSADHLLTKIRLLLPDEHANKITGELCGKAYKVYEGLSPEDIEKCRYLEHKRWFRFYVMNNWAYSEVRDNASRHHTMLVEYDKLTPAEQALDDSAWEVLSEVAKVWQ